jgi:hypothetical protein
LADVQIGVALQMAGADFLTVLPIHLSISFRISRTMLVRIPTSCG